MKRQQDLIFEETIIESWESEPKIVEVPLDRKPFVYAGVAAAIVALAVLGKMYYLGLAQGDFYKKRAAANLDLVQKILAPRGLIRDRNGMILADSIPTFSVFLKADEFFKDKDLQSSTLKAVNDILGMSPEKVSELFSESDTEKSNLIALSSGLSSAQVIHLRALNLPTLSVDSDFQRRYADGEIFSSVLGYVGLASPDDLKKEPKLSPGDSVGKSGLEYYYNNLLTGQDGGIVSFRNAKGKIMGDEEKNDPVPGNDLNLTIDGEFQKYFYERMRAGLLSLGRTKGVSIAFDPRNGEVLALMNFPTYDNNIFETSGKDEEKRAVLASADSPLFNRALAGLYSPGSTIKPLVGVAALVEGVVDSLKTVFSPGYLDVPNPYDPSKPTRFLDWRYQGDVNLYSAIAQSSDVYFYEIGGGFPWGGIKGLGIKRLNDWWQKFNLGSLTGIDLPGEKEGFLPTPEWKEKTSQKPWLIGDTYNVSIGQGDLAITPLALINYIAAIANGGRIYQPVVNRDTAHPRVAKDLSSLSSAIGEVQKGMVKAVTSPLGTAYLLHDLPFPVAAKTGSAQVNNNQQENAFFVGYTPADNPQIVVLILVERSLRGSLNAVPIAKDVLSWYYENRIKK